MSTPPSSAPEPYSQPGQPTDANPYAQAAQNPYAPQPLPGEPGGPTLEPGADGVAPPPQHDTVKPGLGILLGLIGGAIFGFTFLTWAQIGNIDPLFADIYRGEPTSFPGRDGDLTGFWVGFVGLGMAVLGGTLRQGTVAAVGGLIGSGLSALAGGLTLLSVKKISDLNQELNDLVGGNAADLGLPQLEIGIGLWLTLAASVVGIAVGVLAYTTRNRINPPAAPGISASDSGATPAPGLY